ncbi:MAG: glycoside hydrolase family 15 protein [Acidimicrobiia bacterium]
MTQTGCEQAAPGGPGIEPRWTSAVKEAVGTAHDRASHVWYTIAEGVLTEVYWPTLDRPQVRDLEFLVTDGETFFHEERDLEATVEPLAPDALGFVVITSDPEGRYLIRKEVFADPDQSCVVLRCRFEVASELRSSLRLFVLCSPHLEIGGWGNTGEVASVGGRTLLTAHKGRTWMALGCSAPFLRASCGYVGVNDGWQDLADNFHLDWNFDCARDGNIALTGEIDLEGGPDFTVVLAFSDCRHGAITALFQTLGHPVAELRDRFVYQWKELCGGMLPLEKAAGDGGALYRSSKTLLVAHEDKLYPGAMIASLSIPWGDSMGDAQLGGYHLVWTRDLVNSATGLLAAGSTDVARRALLYLAASQLPDGGFYQNFWITGAPYWQGVQLDEVAFPILLAWRLHEMGALGEFHPYPLVLRAAGYLVRHGPATPQERWEEAGGYSPSTLATNIAALICAADLARDHGDPGTARFLAEYADFLERHVEDWTVTSQGSLLPDVPRHYIRINPVDPADSQPDEDPDRGVLRVANRPPGEQAGFPAREVVDAGFLELVRYGIRSPTDSLIEDSLVVVDSVLKVDTPFGPAWHRYNHDGYGQQEDGGPYHGWGKGRAWPLLTGERGHYELAAGRPVEPFISALEGFAHGIGLLPEQVWDDPARPETLGLPTGAAMPLMWAHAEYIKLLRSAVDGEVFDRIPAVAQRYQGMARPRRIEVWKPNRRIGSVRAGRVLRVQAPEPFLLHWTRDEWQTAEDTRSTATAVGVCYVDIEVSRGQQAPVRFTFHWDGADRWEGTDYSVKVT